MYHLAPGSVEATNEMSSSSQYGGPSHSKWLTTQTTCRRAVDYFPAGTDESP